MANDYRKMLKSHLEMRCATNPRYSLRAFARDLGLAPSKISEVLNGKQGLSAKSAFKIASRLGLSKDETDHFCKLVLVVDSRSKKDRKAAEQTLLKYDSIRLQVRALEEDVFKVISDWYHYSILELTTLPGFKSNPAWIAKKLLISVYEVEQGVDRLKRLGLLTERNGKLVSTEKNLATSHDIPSGGIRKFTRQMLEKATIALEMQSVAERDMSTLTVGIDPADLPAYKEMITGFRRQLNAFALSRAEAKGATPTEVYSLGIQFFRLTNKDCL